VGWVSPVPETRPVAVYRLFAADGALLYVGSTHDPERRFRQHSSLKSWWPEVAARQVDWKDSREAAEHAEDAAIMTEAPRYNGRDQHSPGGGGPHAAKRPGAAGYVQLAARLRRYIYDGEYPQGAVLPAETALAARYQVSRALVNRALLILADEGLVSQEQGRGTYACPRRLYRVTVEVPFPDATAAAAGLGAAVAAAAAAEPAVSELELAGPDGGLYRVTLLVDAAGGDRAVHVAALVVAAAAAGRPWDGWDLTLAWYAAGPL
jgi:hypothetical protein